MTQYLIRHISGSSRYLMIQKPQHKKSLRLQIAFPPLIFSATTVVTQAIGLDHHTHFKTTEIDDVSIDHTLSAKLRAAHLLALQKPPQHALSLRRPTTKALGAIEHHTPGTMCLTLQDTLP